MRLPALLAALALTFAGTNAAANMEGSAPPIGASYEVWIEQATETKSENSSGSSSSNSAGQVTVLSDGPDGQVVLYDLPPDTSEKDRARQWQWPAKIVYAPDGGAQLLEREAHEARLTAWLKLANWTREACGQWIFTWNAFYIECDLDAVIKDSEHYKPPSAELAAGVLFTRPGALAPVPLVERTLDDGRIVLEATLALDPDYVRAEMVESALVVAQITAKPLTLDEAKAAHADDVISGSIKVQFDLTAAPDEWVRTDVTQMTVDEGKGEIETRKATRVTTWTRTN